MARAVAENLAVAGARKVSRLNGEAVVCVRHRVDDETMRARASKQGARWDPQARLWRMPLRVARALRLQRQIVQTPDL